MKKDIDLQILNKIYSFPNVSQRKLASELGFSLGKLNYSIKRLKKNGLIKIKVNKKNSNLKTTYHLTSKAQNFTNLIDVDFKNTSELNNFKRKKTYLIAEIGINHNGSLSDAKKLIKLAKKYDFDAVKFQKRDLEICVPEHQKKVMRETPWGLISYLDYKKKIELNISQYALLRDYAKKLYIDIFASCWDINSLNQLKKLKFKYNKIASAMITNLEFLKAVAKEKKKTFISTGMCSMLDVENAVRIFNSYNCEYVLMHSISVYPCDESLLNLNFIRTLKKKFKCEVGYSGHESSVSPSVTAFFLGADYIERHITLDRANWGTDQAASLEDVGMERLTTLIRKIPNTLGDGNKKFLFDEKKNEKKMRYWVNN